MAAGLQDLLALPGRWVLLAPRASLVILEAPLVLRGRKVLRGRLEPRARQGHQAKVSRGLPGGQARRGHLDPRVLLARSALRGHAASRAPQGRQP